jgi:hypothetical protein
MRVEITKLVGHVRDVIQPRKPKDGEGSFYGFIVSEENEKLYFHCRDLRAGWGDSGTALINKVVAFEAIHTPPHEMRQAVNIEIISGAAA